MTRKSKTQTQSRQSNRTNIADKAASSRASGRQLEDSTSRSSAAVRDRASGTRSRSQQSRGNGNENVRDDSGRFENRDPFGSQRSSARSRADSDYRSPPRNEQNDWAPERDNRDQEPSRYRDDNRPNYSRPGDYDHGREIPRNDNRYQDDRGFRGSAPVRRSSSQDSGRYQGSGNGNELSRGQRGNYPDSNLNGPREDYREDAQRFENDPDYGRADRGGRPDDRDQYRNDDRGYRGESDDRGFYRSERDNGGGAEFDRGYSNRDAGRSSYRTDEVSRREYASVGGRNDPQESWRGNGSNERSSSGNGNGRSTRSRPQSQSVQSRSGRKTTSSRTR